MCRHFHRRPAGSSGSRTRCRSPPRRNVRHTSAEETLISTPSWNWRRHSGNWRFRWTRVQARRGRARQVLAPARRRGSRPSLDSRCRPPAFPNWRWRHGWRLRPSRRCRRAKRLMAPAHNAVGRCGSGAARPCDISRTCRRLSRCRIRCRRSKPATPADRRRDH